MIGGRHLRILIPVMNPGVDPSRRGTADGCAQGVMDAPICLVRPVGRRGLVTSSGSAAGFV